MDRKNLKEFLNGMGFKNVSFRRNKWVDLSCPFSPWEHEGGLESGDGTFGIHINSEGPSHYNCFACGAKGGSMEELLVQLQQYVDVSEKAFQFINNHENKPSVDSILDRETDDTPAQQYTSDAPTWDRDELEPYLDTEPTYFLERGFSRRVLRRWDIGYDNERERVVIPVYNRRRELIGMQGRATWPSPDTPYYNYWNFPRSEAVYGIHEINEHEPDSMCVCEGPTDVLRLFEHGIPAVAIFGSNPTKKQIRMIEWFDIPVYLMMDGDRAGREGVRWFMDESSDDVPTYNAICPDGRDPDDLSGDEIDDLICSATLSLS